MQEVLRTQRISQRVIAKSPWTMANESLVCDETEKNHSLLELNGKVVAMHAMKVHGRTKAQIHSFLT